MKTKAKAEVRIQADYLVIEGKIKFTGFNLVNVGTPLFATLELFTELEPNSKEVLKLIQAFKSYTDFTSSKVKLGTTNKGNKISISNVWVFHLENTSEEYSVEMENDGEYGKLVMTITMGKKSGYFQWAMFANTAKPV